MPPKPFSGFTPNDKASIITVIQQLGYNKVTDIAFVHNAPFTNFYSYTITQAFQDRITAIKEIWDLSLSEASRRTFIDIFLVEAYTTTQEQSLLAGLEYNVSQNLNLLGTGQLDYILSTFTHTSPRTPVFKPSSPFIIIEAKKNNVLVDNGEYQLISEMVTCFQQMDSIANVNRIHGILTDGETWIFYEFRPNTRDSYFNIYKSIINIVDMDGTISNDNAETVVNALCILLFINGNVNGNSPDQSKALFT